MLLKEKKPSQNKHLACKQSGLAGYLLLHQPHITCHLQYVLNFLLQNNLLQRLFFGKHMQFLFRIQCGNCPLLPIAAIGLRD